MKKLFLVCFLFLSFSVLQTGYAQGISNDNSNPVSTFRNQISSIYTADGFLSTPWAANNANSDKASQHTDKKSILKETKDLIESLSALQYKYAMMLNVNVESLKNSALLGFIDNWFGTRYRYGGTTKKGIDCSALTGSLLLGVYGLALPRTAKEQYKSTEHISKEDLKEGDLVFFNTKGYVSHVGLYLENGYFLHASSSQGVTISNLNEEYFQKTFICGGRIQKNQN